MTKKLICIVGPTAVGKTAVGVQLAKKLNNEIWNWLTETNGLNIPLKEIKMKKIDHKHKGTF